jgi:hypothetical protein
MDGSNPLALLFKAFEIQIHTGWSQGEMGSAAGEAILTRVERYDSGGSHIPSMRLSTQLLG